MKEKCILYDNTYIYRLFGIIFLIIILIFSLIYLYYINNKKYKDTFKNLVKPPDKIIDLGVGCFASEQGNVQVSTRPCSIYFTENEEKCDNYEKYYDMTLLELEENMLKEKNNKELYSILEDIANEKKTGMNKLNINKCKYTYPDWKEIKSIKDSKFPENDNIIYPRKNINRDGDNNYNFINTCIKEYSTDVINGKSSAIIDINKTKIISGMCEYPIRNITDFNYDKVGQEYLAVNFNNSLPYEDLYQNICFNYPKYNISIPKEYIIKFSCIMRDNATIIDDISIIKYDTAMDDFIEEPSIQILDNIIGNFFRFSYNNSTKYIYYTTKLINTNSLKLKYDMCNNIINITPIPIKFTFKNFNIDDTIISSVTTGPLINGLNTINDKDESVDYFNKIIEITNKITNDIVNDNNIINDEIVKVENEIINLNESLNNVDKEIIEYQRKIDISKQKIIDAQTATENAINNLKEANTKAKNAKDYNEIVESNKNLKKNYDDAVKAAKSEYNRITTENDNNYKNSKRNYNTSLSNYNKALANYNRDLRSKNLNERFFKNIFINGLYFSKSDFRFKFRDSHNDFTKRYIYNEADFDNALKNNSPFYSKIISLKEPNFDDYSSKYISLFGPANQYDYFVVEINGNIKITKTGYYHFAINCDDAGDMFLIFKNNAGRLVRKNVANFYNGHAPDMSYNLCSTTLYPIFIDASINNGYFGIYMRVHEYGGGAAIRPYFSLVTEGKNYNGIFYDLMNEGINFQYTTFILLNKTIVGNIKELANINNDNKNPFYINNNVKYSYEENFYVNMPNIILNRPTKPIAPERNPPPVQKYIQPPIYKDPSSASVLSTYANFDLVPIPSKYIENLEPSITEENNRLQNIKNDISNKINLDLLNKSEKEKNKGIVDNEIRYKNNILATKKYVLKTNNENIENILRVENSLKKFHNFKNYNLIKSLIKNGININNYDNNIFEDNYRKRYIYMQINS